MRARAILLALSLGLVFGTVGPGQAVAASKFSSTRLYSQDAENGSLVPTGKGGRYLLTLRGVKPRALWFDNVPGKLQGSVTNPRLLGLIFGGGGKPISAAVDAWDPRVRDDVVMGVELLGGSWDARSRVLRYRVRDLHAASRPAAGRVGAKLPRRFSEVGVFIDGVCAARECVSGGSSIPRKSQIGKVFVQDAGRGSFRPAGKHGQYRLTLHGAKPQALWFQDRPGVLAGTVPQRKMLDPFFATPGGESPNAAIDAWDPTVRDDVTVAFKLLDGNWDPEHRVLHYLVRPLRAAPGGLPPATLPRRFSQAGVYVNDCAAGCADLISNLVTLYGYLESFFTKRNTCTSVISNETGRPLHLIRLASADHDDWNMYPDATISNRASGVFSTVSGWLRGCYALAEYEREYVGGNKLTVGVALEDPYHGSNEFGCAATAPYSCFLEQGHFNGDHLVTYYCILERTSEKPKDVCPFTED